MFFKWFLICCVCLSVGGLGAYLSGTNPEVTEQEVTLVLDVPADMQSPDSFRTAEIILLALIEGNSTINRQGLDTLNVSGSAEFSETGLLWLKQHLGKNLIIVDLRQESHGFLNGAAITWYSEKNWINLGRTHEQALQDERDRLTIMAGNNTVRVYDPDAVKYGIPDPGSDVGIEEVYSEQELAEKLGIRYFRLTVPDHMRPDDEEVDRFVAFVRTLDDKDLVHYHCRAGHGRTTTFMVMNDMMRNADRVSFEDIIARQAYVSPYYNMSDYASKTPVEIYKDREDFLRQFYEYAIAFRAGDTADWSEWLKETAATTNGNASVIRDIIKPDTPFCPNASIFSGVY